MTDNTFTPERIKAAKALLHQHGYVVLREKSYRQAEQRQAIAKAEASWADKERLSTQHWAQTELYGEIRNLRDRCTFLYGLAVKLGATREQLSNEFHR